MNNATRILVLKLAQLEMEYSAAELRAAMNILDEIGGAKNIFSVHSLQEKKESRLVPQDSKGNKRDSMRDRFLSLKDSDARKYELLRNFESLLLTGAVLSQFDDLRKFGAAVSKRFFPRKSRKESIYPLLSVIAEMPVEHIERLLETAKKEPSVKGDSSYQGLAEFIISGKK